MLESLVSGILGVAGAVVGAFITYILTKKKFELEVEHLKIEVSKRDLEREKMHLEMEKLRAEIDVMKQQEEKLKAEIGMMRQQEIKLLKDEFWQRVGARAMELRADQRELRWPLLKEAFWDAMREEQQQDVVLSKLSAVFAAIYETKTKDEIKETFEQLRYKWGLPPEIFDVYIDMSIEEKRLLSLEEFIDRIDQVVNESNTPREIKESIILWLVDVIKKA